MQKKLIVAALAGLAAAPVFAQSNVTVYGRVDYGFMSKETESSAGTAKQKVAAAASNQTTSRLGFSGSEDLGNGLKANFVVEYKLNAGSEASSSDNSSPLNNRHMNVGVSGGFGTITAGRQWSSIERIWWLGTAADTNNIQGQLYTASSGGFKGHATRIDNAIEYTSPNLSGLTLTVQHGRGLSDSATGDKTGNKATSANAIYKAGALAVGGGYNKSTAEAAGAGRTETTAYALGGNFDMGVAKLFGMYSNVEAENESGTKTSDRDGYELGVIVPFGKTSFTASFYDGEDKKTATATDYKGYQAGLQYSLSKRTRAYALYGVDKEKAASRTEITQYAVGLRHDF